MVSSTGILSEKNVFHFIHYSIQIMRYKQIDIKNWMLICLLPASTSGSTATHPRVSQIVSFKRILRLLGTLSSRRGTSGVVMEVAMTPCQSRVRARMATCTRDPHCSIDLALVRMLAMGLPVTPPTCQACQRSVWRQPGLERPK